MIEQATRWRNFEHQKVYPMALLHLNGMLNCYCYEITGHLVDEQQRERTG
jgi:hypothetical protein